MKSATSTKAARPGQNRPSEWRFIVLNPFALGLMGRPRDDPTYKQALSILKAHNPNDVESQGKTNWFAGLTGDEVRFVPFNGAFGEAQRGWLAKQLSRSAARGEKVVVLSHVPLIGAAGSARTTAWDGDEVCDVLAGEDGRRCVVAVIAGHWHPGGSARDTHGLFHWTAPAPLTHSDAAGGGGCYGIVDVYEDRMEVFGAGETFPTMTIDVPDTVMRNTRSARSRAAVGTTEDGKQGD
jgi:manganese-dependent ADP-ribose/CDP-alcohol diphosphatase